MKAAFGRVANIKSFPSMGIARLEIEVPIESYVDVVSMLFGQDALVTVASPGFKEQMGRYGVHESSEEEPSDTPAVQQEKAAGLTKLAGILCKDPEFWRFLNVFNNTFESRRGTKCQSEDDAARYVREYCGIKSRRELDQDTYAATNFHALRLAWLDWRGDQ